MLSTTIITPAQMYWITRMDSFNCVLGLLTFVLSLASIFFLVGYIVSSIEGQEELFNIMKRWFFACGGVLTIVVTAFILTPTTKEMCTIIVVPAIANNEKVQNLGNEIYDLAVEWLKEIKPGKEEK